jgi:hypothetical protein
MLVDSDVRVGVERAVRCTVNGTAVEVNKKPLCDAVSLIAELVWSVSVQCETSDNNNALAKIQIR